MRKKIGEKKRVEVGGGERVKRPSYPTSSLKFPLVFMDRKGFRFLSCHLTNGQKIADSSKRGQSDR